MTKIGKVREKILSGTSDRNISFEDLRNLLRHLGFAERIRGDHHIFTREGIAEILNLQPRGGKGKPYQVKQVRGVIAAYGLGAEPNQPAEVEKPSGDSDESQSQESSNGK